MCRELAQLREAIRTFAVGFDARSLTPAQAGSVARLCSVMESSISAVKAMAAARAAEAGGWKAGGYRSPGDHLAAEAGVSPSRARELLATGRRLADQPEVAQAALSGDLSAEQAALVSDGAEVAPDRTRQLLERARHASLGELRDEVARTKAAAVDLEARRRAIRARRRLVTRVDPEGEWHLHASGNPEDGALVHGVLAQIRRRLIVARRDRGVEREPFEALEFDALVELSRIAQGVGGGDVTFADLLELGLFPAAVPAVPAAPSTASSGGSGSGAGGSGSPGPTPVLPVPVQTALLPDESGAPTGPGDGPPPSSGRQRRAGPDVQLQIRVDLQALLRGHPVGGELCEVVGYGPVPVSVVEEQLEHGHPFVVALLTKGEDVGAVVHYGRAPKASQRSLLTFLSPTCTVLGCNVKASLQFDHRVDWVHCHVTLTDLLDRLCVHHHRLKTTRNWALVDGSGKRAFVPPDDPRHPGIRRTLPATLPAGPLPGGPVSTGSVSAGPVSASPLPVGASVSPAGPARRRGTRARTTAAGDDGP